MVVVLVFASVLLTAVLVSGLANRTVLSTAVLFLVAGFVLGDGMLGVVHVRADDTAVGGLAQLALFSVLFTDGMRAGLRECRSAWRLPGRALVLGLPLTLAGTAILAHVLVGLTWTESFLLGAVLSPTDPVFAAAIVGREEIPYRLRNMLNVESGLNDGLALPVVVVLLTALGPDATHPLDLIAEVLGGIAIGVVIPAVAIRLEQSHFFHATTAYEPLNAFAIGLIVLALASLTHANLFLAAFAAGITVATMSPAIRDAFNRFGELVTELLKLVALLIFGALISPAFLGSISATGYLFAATALLLARPVALGLALLGSRLHFSRTHRRRLVRTQRLRIRRLRAAHPQGTHPTRRRTVPPRRARRRGFDPCALLHRRDHRPLVPNHRQRRRHPRNGLMSAAQPCRSSELTPLASAALWFNGTRLLFGTRLLPEPPTRSRQHRVGAATSRSQ